MNIINLVGTRHREIGKCTIANLYRIIEKINPNLIFEETNPEEYKLIYEIAPALGHETKNIEHNTIQKYIKNHNIEHIPIDSFKMPEKFDKWNRGLYHCISISEEYIKYNELCEYIEEYCSEKGFEGINTKEFEDLLIKKQQLYKKYLFNCKKDEIENYNMYMKFVYDDREKEMINNINNYISKNTDCFNAIFLIGAEHRLTIIEKLKTIDKIEINFNI